MCAFTNDEESTVNSEVNLNTVIRLSLTFGLTLVKKEADAVMSAEVSLTSCPTRSFNHSFNTSGG